ncbi:3-oxoacyl-[acyl-carrier-protein] synthase 3 [Actinoplanes sp. NBRC 14428]|uniref:3-oxoacyl-[acyl-carrier-protein] synthase-3 n=1 Tax=Pseudosporangium ferrugineum TaxID=439699 RepID=A0A2T0SIQ9_9ACTN|nr:ketoacyl-ACP synthase III [Pseudosporangium ferrugineum]PRY33289.1 3-oxoacyl-[acyl-carrier-protein] synthase-3 [Pseudosporangium ferrugineum]BCJ48713.1 3-oxoacyl-[acyl-carrier-protein] synthase 3 [Actinoplanes sp. NBRC 14428]
MQSIPSAGILGTGSYVPEHEVTNEALVERVTDTTPEWIARKTLIEARRFAAPDQATSDLAVRAATAALADAGIGADRVDYLIVATSTGDSPQPPTASLVQHAIGAHRAACFDINVVCAGFVFGLALANSLVTVKPDTVVLVVAADVYSRILDFDDRRTAILFGDGAGAAVVGAVPSPYGIIDLELVTRGDAHELIHVKAGGSRLPASAETVAGGDHFFRMNGRGVRDFVLSGVPPVLETLLKRAGVTADEIDHFVPHQANGVMIQELVDAAGLASARTHLVLDRYGNTGSGSAAVALDAAARAGALHDGDLVLVAGFGGGMSVGAALMRWYAS